jgi:membrane-associated phospholipid phosphatase
MPVNKRRHKIVQYVIGTLAIGFLLLTAFVFFFPASLIDREFSQEIQEHQNPILDTVMKAISYPGYMPCAPIMVIVTALVFFILKFKREALFVLLTLSSAIISSVIKLIINRPRPAEPLVRVIVRTTQQSFPSGHVLFYVMFFGFVTLLMFEVKNISKYIKWSVVMICMFLLFSISYSRVYLGAHWFTDVIAGFLLGLIGLYILAILYLKPTSQQKKKQAVV